MPINLKVKKDDLPNKDEVPEFIEKKNKISLKNFINSY